MTEPLTALYVRVPTALAHRLDQHTREHGRSKQAVVTSLLNDELGGSTRSTPPPATPEILDIDETAELLRVDVTALRDRISRGDFPARRFGQDWRCARQAVLDWMAGTDAAHDHPTGF